MARRHVPGKKDIQKVDAHSARFVYITLRSTTEQRSTYQRERTAVVQNHTINLMKRLSYVYACIHTARPI